MSNALHPQIVRLSTCGEKKKTESHILILRSRDFYHCKQTFKYPSRLQRFFSLSIVDLGGFIRISQEYKVLYSKYIGIYW